jgi:tape measure domain-containing protein
MSTSLGDLRLDIFAPLDRLESDLDRASNLIAARAQAWDAQLRKELSVGTEAAEADLMKSLDRMREATKEPLSISFAVGEGAEDLADLDGLLSRIRDRASQLADIRVGLTIDDADGLATLQKQVKATPLKVALSVFAEGTIVAEALLSRSLREMQAMARKYPIKIGVEISTANINEQIANLNKQTIVPQVDDRRLTALNEHLSKKQTHLKEVISDFRSNPIVPLVDLSQLDAAEQRLAQFSRHRQSPSIGIDTFDITKNSKIKISEQNSFLGSIKEGIGIQIGTQILKGLGSSLRQNFGFDLAKSVKRMTNIPAVQIKGVLDDREIQKSIQNLRSEIGKVGLQARYAVGDAIVSGIDYRKTVVNSQGKKVEVAPTIQDRISEGLRVAVPKFQRIGERAKQDLTVAAREVGDTFVEKAAATNPFGTIDRSLRNYREQAIRDLAIPQAVARAQEIVHSGKTLNTGNAVTPDTKELIIVTGGYAGARGLSGKRLAKEIRSSAADDAVVIWTKNEETDIPKEAMGRASAKARALATSLARPNLRGYSNDAVEMAAQALVALQKNPNLQIKFLGESGGGFAAEEAAQILRLAGISKASYLGVGTPDFIGGITRNNGRKIISPDEFLGAETYGLYSRIGLARRPKNQILGVQGHPFEHYQEAKVAELENFLKGTPGKLKKKEIDQIQEAADAFKNLDLTGKSSREIEEIARQAYQNLQTIRRYIAGAIGAEKKQLESIAATFQEVYVRTAAEPRSYEQTRTAIAKARDIKTRIDANPGLEAGQIATQLATELQQYRKEFRSQSRNAIGTLGLKKEGINGELDRLIAELSDPSTIVPLEARASYQRQSRRQTTKPTPLSTATPTVEAGGALSRRENSTQLTATAKAREIAANGLSIAARGTVTIIGGGLSVAYGAQKAILGQTGANAVNALGAAFIASRLPGGAQAIGLLGQGVSTLAHMPIEALAGQLSAGVGGLTEAALGNVPLLKGAVPQISQGISQFLTAGAGGLAEGLGTLAAPFLAGGAALKAGSTASKALPGYNSNLNQIAQSTAEKATRQIISLLPDRQKEQQPLQLPSAIVQGEFVNARNITPGTLPNVRSQARLAPAIDPNGAIIEVTAIREPLSRLKAVSENLDSIEQFVGEIEKIKEGFKAAYSKLSEITSKIKKNKNNSSFSEQDAISSAQLVQIIRDQTPIAVAKIEQMVAQLQQMQSSAPEADRVRYQEAIARLNGYKGNLVQYTKPHTGSTSQSTTPIGKQEKKVTNSNFAQAFRQAIIGYQPHKDDGGYIYLPDLATIFERLRGKVSNLFGRLRGSQSVIDSPETDYAGRTKPSLPPKPEFVKNYFSERKPPLPPRPEFVKNYFSERKPPLPPRPEFVKNYFSERDTSTESQPSWLQQFVNFQRKENSLIATFKNVGSSVKKFAQDIFALVPGSQYISAAFGFLRSLVGNAAGLALGLAGAGTLLLSTTNIKKAFDYQSRSLRATYSTGSRSGGQQLLEKSRQEASGLGIDLSQSIDTDTELAGATKGSAFEGYLSGFIGSAFKKGAAVRGLNADQQQRAFAAVKQMLGKGGIYAEELRGQLAESGFSDAIPLLSRALGMSTPQLTKLMSQGGSLGSDATLKLAVQIDTEATQGIKELSTSGNHAMTRLGNTTQELQIKAGQVLESGAIVTLNAVTKGVELLTRHFDFLSKAVTASALVFGGRFVIQLAQSVGLIPQVITLKDVIQKASFALQALGNSTTWTSLAAGARTAALSIGRIAAPIALALAGFEAIGSIINSIKVASGDLSMEAFGDSVKKATENLADMQEALNRLKPGATTPVKIEGAFEGGNILENAYDGTIKAFRKLPVPILPTQLRQSAIPLVPLFWGSATTFEEGRQNNAQLNINQLLSVSRTSRSTANNILPLVNQQRIEEIDRELTLINLQRNNPYTKDSKVLQSLNEREGKLNVEKIEILRPLSNAAAGIDTLIANTKQTLESKELKALINNPQTRGTGLAQQNALIGELEELRKVQASLGKATNQTTERLVDLKNNFLQLNGVMGQALQTIERNSIARTINLNNTANPLNTGAIEAESMRLQENKLRLENEARRNRADKLLQDLRQPRNNIIANELLSSKNTDLDSITLEQIQELEDANKSNPETLEIVRRMALYVKLKDEFIRGEQSLSENLASQRRAGIQAELAMGDYHRSIRRQLEESASAFNLAKIQFNRTSLRSQLLSALNGGQNFVSQFVESVAGIFETLGSIPEIINRGSNRTREIIQQSTDRRLEQQRVNEQNNRAQPVDTPTPPRPNDRGAIQNQPVTFLSGGKPITNYSQINTHHDGPAYQFATIGGRREAIRSDVTARERAQGVIGSGPRVVKDFVINRNGSVSIPIPSATAGRVVLTPEAASGGYGNLVTVIGDDDRILGRYAHLSQFLVGEGDRVVPGQGLGIQGSTGTSTGIHGHVELSAADWERYFTALRTGNFGGSSPATSQPSVPQGEAPPVPITISPEEFQRYIPSIANPNRGRRIPFSQQRRANPPRRSPAARGTRSVPSATSLEDRTRRPIPTIPPIPTVDRRLPIRRKYTGANGNLRFNSNFLAPQKEISAIPESTGIRAALGVISRGETLNYSERNSYFFGPGGGSIVPPNSGWPSVRENIGRYGFNATDYNDLRQFNPDIQGFDPVSQDLMAIAKLQMRGRGGRELKDLLANPTLASFRRFREAASAEWESLRPNFMRIQGQTDESLFALFREEVRRGALTPAGRSYTFADGDRQTAANTRPASSNRPTNPTPLPQVPTARELTNPASPLLDRIDTQNIEGNSLNTQSELRNALTNANREILNTDESFRQGRLTAGDNQRQTIQSLQDLFHRSAIPSIQTDLTQQLRETNRTFDEEDRKLERQIFDLQRQIATARQTIQTVTPIIENPATDEREKQTAEYTRNQLNAEIPNIEKRLVELQNYRQQLPAERTRALANISRLTRMADRSQQISRDRLFGEQVNTINQYGTQFLQSFAERNPTARINPDNDPLYTREADNLRSARVDRAQSEFDLDRQFVERRFSSNPVTNRQLYQQALQREEQKYRAREAAARRERRYGEVDREINRRTAERQLSNESGQLNIDLLGTRSRSLAAFSHFNPNLNFTPEGNSIDLQYRADTAGEKQRYENQREELLDRWERSELPEVQAQIRQQLELAYQQHQQTIRLLNRQLTTAKTEEQIRLRQYQFTRQSTFASSNLNILRAGIEVRRSIGDETNSGYLERDAAVADLELAHRQQRDDISNKLSRGEINAAEASQLFSELERVKDLKLQALTSQFSDLGFLIRTTRGEVNSMFASFFEGKSAIESLGNAWNGLMRQIGNRFASKLTDSLSGLIFGTGNHPTAQPGQQDFLRMLPFGQLARTPEVYGPPSPNSNNDFFGNLFGFAKRIFGFADGGIIPGGAFGSGGITSGSQLALIGEGRYNEAVVPLPDGRSIPVKMNDLAGKFGNTNVSITFNSNGSAEVNTDGAQAFAQMATNVFYNLVAKEKRPGGTLNGYR